MEEAPRYHPLTVAVLPLDTLKRLVIACRKGSAKLNPKEYDCRDNLDYPPRDRESVNFIRHCLINRDDRSLSPNGYLFSYDQMVFKIMRDNPPDEGDHMVRNLKAHILLLIKEHYPSLKLECEHQLFQLENRTCKNDESITNDAPTT